MTSSFVLLLIVLAVLSASFVYLVQAEGGFDKLPQLLERGLSYLGIEKKLPPLYESPARSHTPVPNEFTSGNSRFSQGTCKSDTDCAAGGCSGEVCSSEKDTVSTCEFSDSFPNVQGYACGCVQGKCGWR